MAIGACFVGASQRLAQSATLRHRASRRLAPTFIALRPVIGISLKNIPSRLWLVPYLCFGIFGGALHNHGPLPDEVLSAFHSSSSSGAQAATAQDAHNGHSDADCFACLWQANHAVFADASSDVAISEMALPLHAAVVAAPFTFPLSTHSRGPPRL